MISRYLYLLLSVVFITACQSAGGQGSKNIPDEVKQISENVRQLYVPDKRVAIYDIDFSISDNKITIKGKTTSPQARESLMDGLGSTGYAITDSIRLLPDTVKLNGHIYGIVNLSVANLHLSADHASEMQTQALLGMPVRILEHDNWYRIQTPDKYIAWVHRAGIVPVTSSEYDAWNQADKVVVTVHNGFTYEKPDTKSQTVSDVVAGNRLRYEGKQNGFYRVSYPDGRKAYLPESAARSEGEWRSGIKQDAASILETAYTMIGIPYLWAGTSSKGMDCSGFVRNVLIMHDIIIPRDASQQALVGQRIEIESDFGNLIPGDLLFFGRRATPESKERIVHVAIYIGNKRFIHAQGDVRLGSLDSNDELYDEFNHNRLLFATRFLDAIGTEGINTTATNEFYLHQ